MRRSIGAFVAAVVVSLVFPTAGWAVLSLELSSSDDLLNLQVGDTATIDVSLAGLDTAGGQELVTLSGSVKFPASLLGTPFNITPGLIIPNPLADPFDFQTVEDPGQADATFLTFSVDSATHITTNGVFFSFDVTTTPTSGGGSGAFTIDLTASDTADVFNPNDPDNPDVAILEPGPDLPFAIQAPPGGAVPEPLTAGLSMMGLTALGISTKRRTGRS